MSSQTVFGLRIGEPALGGRAAGGTQGAHGGLVEVQVGAEHEVRVVPGTDRLVELHLLVLAYPAPCQTVALEQELAVRVVRALEQRIDGTLERRAEAVETRLRLALRHQHRDDLARAE